MKHEIKIEELIEWRKTQEILYASSSTEQKRLFVTLKGEYKLYHKGELKLETHNIIAAVANYNGI